MTMHIRVIRLNWSRDSVKLLANNRSKFLSVVRSRVKNTKCWNWSRVFPDTTSCVTATTLSLTLTLCPNPKPYTELRCLRRSAFRPLRGRSARFAVGHHFLVYPLCF